jgi:hypothetical protein
LLLEFHAVGERLALAGLAALVVELVGHVLLGDREVHVADGDNVLARRESQRVLRALAAKSDDGDVERVARRLIPDAAQHVTRHDHHAESELARVRDEIAPGDLSIGHGHSTL